MTNNMTAHKMWAHAPADTRFWTLNAAHVYAANIRAASREPVIDFGNVVVDVTEDEDIVLVGPSGRPAMLNNWAFTQLSRRCFAGEAAGTLSQLPASLAAQALQHGISRLADSERKAIGLMSPTGLSLGAHQSYELRSLTTERYARTWNADIIERDLMSLEAKGWKVPPGRPCPGWTGETRPATREDCLFNASRGLLAIKPGDTIAPAGIYVSETEMFVIMVSDKPVMLPGYQTPLYRCLMRGNSEVGLRSDWLNLALIDMICGNHILWNVAFQIDFRKRHVGNVVAETSEAFQAAVKAMDSTADSQIVAGVQAAMKQIIAPGQSEVVDTIYGKRIDQALTKGVLNDAFEAASKVERYGDPRSVWGMVNGLTEVSQRSRNFSERAKLDRAAGKLLAKV